MQNEYYMQFEPKEFENIYLLLTYVYNRNFGAIVGKGLWGTIFSIPCQNNEIVLITFISLLWYNFLEKKYRLKSKLIVNLYIACIIGDKTFWCRFPFLCKTLLKKKNGEIMLITVISACVSSNVHKVSREC